jgi:hypothetical protein
VVKEAAAAAKLTLQTPNPCWDADSWLLRDSKSALHDVLEPPLPAAEHAEYSAVTLTSCCWVDDKVAVHVPTLALAVAKLELQALYPCWDNARLLVSDTTAASHVALTPGVAPDDALAAVKHAKYKDVTLAT